MAVGGDGTVHEIVNGIAGRTGIDLAIVPRGTGRDFARTYGIPRKLDDALRTALDGPIREIDLGLARFRSWQGEAAEAYFANIASAGMSGAIAKRANETSKAFGGKASYFWSTFAVFARWRTSEMLLRVGTCGGLQPDLQLGDLIVAVSAVAADATAKHLVGGEPHTPTSDWELVHGAVHYAKELDQPIRVGPIVSSDLFYNPDGGQYERWSSRGILAVEMEAAVLFTLGALRGVQAGCLLTVSDVVVEQEFKRISDEELRAAVDRMTRIALATATAEPKH
ncbi:MAG: hypothetical protein AUH17_00765 [Actinobacteria bacterium 13_2_20CM_68_14]|nr:MAG: hypothetical protein AUH17_00765 [Actinobacteria bacterium 13_2_20CM_68_14]